MDTTYSGSFFVTKIEFRCGENFKSFSEDPDIWTTGHILSYCIPESVCVGEYMEKCQGASLKDF